MNRDPYYLAIEKKLSGELDTELFERAAVALLGDLYPRLVPVPGGADDGMDGAITDGQEPAGPLVTTTARNAIGNLTKNLNSYLASGQSGRTAVFATSQKLTGPRRRNLRKRAAELGFSLIQIHERTDFANRLYRSPKWCRELLGLTLEPPALSILPKSLRPRMQVELVGRAGQLELLVGGKDDALVTGQPGAGKTALLEAFARQTGALFVVDNQIARITEGLLESQPTALIIDDAMTSLDTIAEVSYLRERRSLEFRIIASSWPNDQDLLAARLRITPSAVLQLPLLTRNQIVEVIRATGLAGPGALLNEIVEQARGRPGLANTLARICLLGEVRDVALGDALGRDVALTLAPLMGPQGITILAAFAIGGDAGMPIDRVAGLLDIPRLDLQEKLTQLSGAGIITQVSANVVAVQPKTLQAVLVRDELFAGPQAIPVGELLEARVSSVSTLRALIGARARGAAIEDSLFRDWLLTVTDRMTWQEYAFLGEAESLWALQEYRGGVADISLATLRWAPQETIPKLLQLAVDDERPLNSATDHPLRMLRDWVRSARSGTGEVIQRRRQLLEAATTLTEEEYRQVSLQAITIALSPRFEDLEPEPGSGDKVTFSFGFISPDDMDDVAKLWPKAFDFLRDAELTDTRPLREWIEEWAYLRAPGPTSAEALNKAQRLARRMLRDIIPLIADRMGSLLWAKRLARELRQRLKIEIDPEFELLFPAPSSDWRKAQSSSQRKISRCSEDWANEKPADVVGRFVAYCASAGDLPFGGLRWVVYACQQISQRTSDPAEWAREMLRLDVDDPLIEPFLERLVTEQAEGHVEIVSQALEKESTRGAALLTSLRNELEDDPLIELALARVAGFENLVEVLSLRGDLPQSHLVKLLRHDEKSVAAAAAVGCWEARSRGGGSSFPETDWKKAIGFLEDDHYALPDVLAQNPDVAFTWLSSKMKEGPAFAWGMSNGVTAALSSLDKTPRSTLIEDSNLADMPSDFVRELVGDDLESMRIFMQNDALRRFHLDLVGGRPSESWVPKAQLALDAGHGEKEVAQAAIAGGQRSWVGDESAMWQRWVESFTALESHSDPRIRKVGEQGRLECEKSRDKARAREDQEAIFGR